LLHRQKNYWEMHDALFQHQTTLALAQLSEHARAVGGGRSRVRRHADTGRAAHGSVSAHLTVLIPRAAPGEPTLAIVGVLSGDVLSVRESRLEGAPGPFPAGSRFERAP
jgi:hypothetical protein